jgi:hypothetical protein
MKLPISALVLALSICSVAAYAQQEIDPDHFDRPAASQVQGSRMGSSHSTAAAHHRTNMKVAAKHSPRDASSALSTRIDTERTLADWRFCLISLKR